MKKKHVLKYIDFGQDYWEIAEHHIKTWKIRFSRDPKMVLTVITECDRRSCWDDPSSDATDIDPESFVKITVWHLDEVLYLTLWEKYYRTSE